MELNPLPDSEVLLACSFRGGKFIKKVYTFCHHHAVSEGENLLKVWYFCHLDAVLVRENS